MGGEDYSYTRDPDYVAAQTKLQEALAPLVELFAPRRCLHEAHWEDCEYDGCGWAQSEPIPGYIMGDLVVVANLESLTTGRDIIAYMASPHQRLHVTKGLIISGEELLD